MKEWKVSVEHTRNDRVKGPADGAVWVCRRSHRSEELNGPLIKKGYRWWKENDGRDTARHENSLGEVQGESVVDAGEPG
jgi:hypothetical protein